MRAPPHPNRPAAAWPRGAWPGRCASRSAIGIGAVEQESGHAILDGIHQPAGRVRDGQAAEALRVHLAQPTGFETRRHQQEIGASKHLAGQRLFEADECAHPSSAGPAPHLRFQPPMMRRHICGASHVMSTFLVHQAGDHRAGRGRQAECTAHRVRIGGAPGPLTNAEVGLEMDVTTGVPAGVNAVDDTAQVAAGGAPGQQIMQSATIVRGGDLLRVAQADRVQARGIGDATLQERHLPVEVQFIQVFDRYAQHRCKRIRKQPLVSQVVDGQQGRHGGPVPTHVGCRHGHRPIIQVQQLRRPVQPGTPGRNLRRRV